MSNKPSYEFALRILRLVAAQLQTRNDENKSWLIGNDNEATSLVHSAHIRSIQSIYHESHGPTAFLQNIHAILQENNELASADALRNVIDLCEADKEFGGLGLCDRSWKEVDEASLKEVEFLTDAWMLTTSFSGMRQPLVMTDAAVNVRDPMTLAQKIIAHHAKDVARPEGVRPGDFLRVNVDWIIASELSWVGMKNSLTGSSSVFRPWRNDRFWLSGDHAVDPRNYEEQNVKRFLEGLETAKFDFRMTENQGANQTIMHTEFCRERVQPGMLVLGSDSHTCSAGSISSLAIGLGAADVMTALGTGETWLKVPDSMRINLVGKPAWYIGGKDIILSILQKLKRNTNAAERVVEFGGPGAKWLSCDARFAICNMCTELGAITGIFIPDSITKCFIDGRKRKIYRNESLYFRPDDDARYAEVFDFDLGEVESFLAIYPSPDNVFPVSCHLGMAFDGCFIGACTTTEEDLVLAALVLKVGLDRGLHLAKGHRIVVPGSRPIAWNLERLGLMDIYRRCNYVQQAPGCSLCLGIGADVADAGSNWLSSQNRNFKNRMGKGAIGHICSAATVAASSFTMTLTDPRDLLDNVSEDTFDSFVTRCRSRAGGKIEVTRDTEAATKVDYVQPAFVCQNTAVSIASPRMPITGCPKTPHEISSRIYRMGDFVDTDAIIPGPACAKCKTDEELAAHCFEVDEPLFREAVSQCGLRVLVAQKAFGCGSSREEAVRALKGLGVLCIIAESFSFIFGRNLANMGMLGVTVTDPEFFSKAKHQMPIKIDVQNRKISIDDTTFAFALENIEMQLLRDGGLAASWRKHGPKVFSSLSRGGTELARNSRDEYSW
ncbi:Aconitase AMT8 [Pseudocercospora fuligena]|uniref:Aconitase AMT8 n=1 Tax=Pseudocercospora fuligena TaxID=685502 RepID=A0A8H6VIK7_9PEZI|nr:Aconitase AMT8 [Pseudocercospora fuligena]